MDFSIFTDPALSASVWASLATLTILEIVLGIDNVIFISIIANKLPAGQRRAARTLGLAGALILRIILLVSIAWIIGLTQPVFSFQGFEASWRDIILITGGLFLIYKATNEIHHEVSGEESELTKGPAKTFLAVIAQIMLLDVVFSFDSVITAVGVADHIEVMVIAVVIAVAIMTIAAGPISRFVERNPTTKMLALAFLVMIGMALIADGLHFHVDREYIYAAMIFSGLVEALNLLRGRKRRKQKG